MEKINWKQKLTSRKFWAAAVGFVTALMIAFAAPQATITQVTGIITAGATLIAYIVGEGMIDAASAGATVNITGNPTITGVEDTATAEAEELPASAQSEATEPADTITQTAAPAENGASAAAKAEQDSAAKALQSAAEAVQAAQKAISGTTQTADGGKSAA